MPGVTPQRPSFAPRHWPGWLGVAIFWVIGWLPRPLGMAIGNGLGNLVRWTMAGRRRVVQRNLQRCFPERSDEWREQVTRDCFRYLGRAFIESAWCWSGHADRMLHLGDVEGLQHLLDAEEKGQGVLVVSAHFTCLEIGGRFLAEHANAMGVYRRLKQPVLEWYHTRGRLQYGEGMIEQKDIRGAIRYLRRGGVLWYAPDQDFGPDQSLFVPFFGIPTATLLASHRLPKLTGCAVLFLIPMYDEASGRYRIRFSPTLDDYPSDDPHRDLARINEMIEAQVRQAPGQYWWVHRRFKSRPPDEPSFYA